MDAMALLCMLHADGPSTLKSLRQAGCSSLESIESMGEERLSRVLGGPPAAARRFVREARHLRERLGTDHPGSGILDREESVVETLPPPLGVLEDVRPAMPEPVAADFVHVDDLVEETTVIASSEAADPFDEALEAWRTLDREEAEVPETGALPAEARARPEYEFGAELSTAIRELAVSTSPHTQETSAPPLAAAPFVEASRIETLPSETSQTGGTRLVPGGLDGLDPELCLELAAAGFETVESLADSDPLRLSETLGIAYGKLWRLGCIARRAIAAPSADPSSLLQAIPAADLETSPTLEKLSPSERPWKPVPSILELEWNREIRPQAPPPGHAVPGAYAAGSFKAAPEAAERAREAEGAGGPFV
jgi:hypothetical protein